MARRPTDERTERAQRSVGDRIRERRHELGLSQEELAHRCGFHRTYVGHLERGEVNPTLGTLVHIADGLQVDLTTLVAEA